MTQYDDDEFNQGETGNGLRSALEAAKREAAEAQKAHKALQDELSSLRKTIAIKDHGLTEKQVDLMEKTGLSAEDFVKEYGDLFGKTAAPVDDTQPVAPVAAEQIAANEAATAEIAQGFNQILGAQEAGTPAFTGASDPAAAQIAKILAEGGDARAVDTFLASLPGYGG